MHINADDMKSVLGQYFPAASINIDAATEVTVQVFIGRDEVPSIAAQMNRGGGWQIGVRHGMIFVPLAVIYAREKLESDIAIIRDLMVKDARELLKACGVS